MLARGTVAPDHEVTLPKGARCGAAGVPGAPVASASVLTPLERASVGSLAALWLATRILAWTVGGATDIVVSPAAGDQALLWVSGAVGLWLVASLLVRERAELQLAVLVGGAALTVVASAPNVGREIGVLTAASAVVARAALVSWAPWRGWPPRRHQVVPLGLLGVVAAALAWRSTAAPALPLVILIASLVVIELHHRSSVVARWCDEEPRRLAQAAGRRAWSAGRWVGGVARRSAIAGRPVLLRAWGWAVRWGPLAGWSLLVAAMWTPAFWLLCTELDDFTILGINDVPLHLDVVATTSLVPPVFESPHLLFHVAGRALSWPFGEPGGSVAVMVLSVAGVCGVLARWFARPVGPGRALSAAAAAVVAAGYLFLETPAVVARWLDVTGPDQPFYSIHWWANPTWLLALPFAFATFSLLEGVTADLRDGATVAPARLVGLAVVVVLGALAKPSLALVLLPVLPIHLAVSVGTSSWRRWGPVAVAVVVPCAVVVAWQTWFLAVAPASRFSSSWIIDPVVQPVFGWDATLHPAFYLPLLPVGAALVLTRGRFLREPSVALALACGAVAVPLMLTVRETGERAGHGNFAVPAQTVLAVLVALSVRSLAVLAVEAVRAQRPRPAWARASLVVVGLLVLAFALGGVVSYLAAIGMLDLPLTWEYGGA